MQPLPPKRFCLTVVLLALSAWASVACLNFVVNPYAQYATSWFRPVVQTSRAQKVALLAELPRPPDGLILGSSRVLKLEPEYLQTQTGLRFFNAGVNSAKPEDYLAIVRYSTEQAGRLPRMIVLGLDVAVFADSNAVDARLLSQPELARQVPEAIDWKDRYRRWQELLSWQQTKMSIQSVARHFSGRADQPATETFQPDGLLVYDQRESEIAAGTYDFDAAMAYNLREYKQLFADYPRLSHRRCELFEELVETCQRGDVKLIVFTTPLHPQLAEYLRTTTCYSERRQELLRYLYGMADRHRFQFCDLSEIESFLGSPKLFVDGVHPLEPNTRLMINRMLTPSPRSIYAVQ